MQSMAYNKAKIDIYFTFAALIFCTVSFCIFKLYIGNISSCKVSSLKMTNYLRLNFITRILHANLTMNSTKNVNNLFANQLAQFT